ncbi:arylamine N-acetyltransferase [soil metagenome]
MNINAYIRRLGLTGSSLKADAASLRLLQRSHLLAVPFENLDIYWKRPITVDPDRFFQKMVIGGRGGFCYELNGLFNELLKAIGFETRRISGRVFSGGVYGLEFDHAAIIVTLGGEEYLADVGFGDFTTEPLQFDLGVEQQDASGTFVIRRSEGEYLEVVKRIGDEWSSQYIFTDTPRSLSDFEEMCGYQQSSPDSHFTRGALCSILTNVGRKTLTDKKFIVTTGTLKSETAVETELEFYRLLIDEFGIESSIFPKMAN